MTAAPEYLFPDWPAPPHIKAAVSLRHGGHSQGEFAGFNLGEHVEDDPEAVRRNRQLLRQSLKLPAEPCWLSQVHGTDVCRLDGTRELHTPPVADASVTSQAGQVCAVLTADCLPVLFTDREGRCVAAAHAGWRGLAAGVLEATLASMAVPAGEVLTWLGPAIGPAAFEVGPEVRAAFTERQPESASAFVAAPQGKYMADIFALAKFRLERAGVHQISGGGICSMQNKKDLFSFRRDRHCGRMASLIWMEEQGLAQAGADC